MMRTSNSMLMLAAMLSLPPLTVAQPPVEPARDAQKGRIIDSTDSDGLMPRQPWSKSVKGPRTSAGTLTKTSGTDSSGSWCDSS